MEALKKDLIKLRMKGMAENLDYRLQQAHDSGMSAEDFLKCVVEDEMIRRERKAYNKRLSASGLNSIRTLEEYLFENQPSVNRDVVTKLATCEFINQKDKVICMGLNGCGKSFILNAIGLKAIEKGYGVLKFTAYRLAEQLLRERSEKTYDRFLKKLLKTNFIIINEFASRTFPPGGTDELFDLLDELDEAVSIGITTNRDFKDWKQYFADNTKASAFTDRIINNAVLIKVTSGTSERQKNFEKKNLQYYGKQFNLEPSPENVN